MSFQALLSSFQDATKDTSSTKPQVASKKNNRVKKSSTEQYTKAQPASAEDIEKLWRTSQIQSCFKSESTHHGKSHENSKEDNINQPLHIAVCATIVNDLHHEDIWKKWLKHEPENKSASASIHVHAKSPNSIPKGSWLNSKLIPVCHNPNWNDYRVILAMLSLAEYAIKNNPETTHLMMVTESCIPIGTIEELANIILKDGRLCSFLDVYDINSERCNRYEEHACFNIKEIPKDAIYKALPGWALFSRSHMEEIINISERLEGRELYPLFKTVWAPEEVYFATVLALLGKLNDQSDHQVVRRSIMWSKWDVNSRGSEKAHPIVYDGQFGRELICDVKREGCIFMRKWKSKIGLKEWSSVVLISSDEESGKNSTTARKRKHIML